MPYIFFLMRSQLDLAHLKHGYFHHWVLLIFSGIFKLIFVNLFDLSGFICGYVSCGFILVNLTFTRILKSDFPTAGFLIAAFSNCIYALYVGLNHIIISISPSYDFAMVILVLLAYLATFIVLVAEGVFCFQIQRRLEYEPLVCFYPICFNP